MFYSMLADVDNALISFFTQLTSAIGFGGYLGIAIGIEIFFILMFLIRSFFSYEARMKRCLDKYNNWLFINKKLDKDNIKDFNNLVKKGPRRFVYFWQQYVLFREHEPTSYLSEENLIDKPLKTSSWEGNVKNLTLITTVWAVICLLFGFASQAGQAVFSLNLLAVALVIPIFVLLIGVVTILILKAKRILNLDELYHNYHIFARFITNACVDLPVYIDYDLLFTEKEISRGNSQLREFYEARARKAKEEFENAKQNEIEYVEYDFEQAGIDGSLVLERAMKESEAYLNKKQTILTKIADIDMQKEALKRNFENTQKDLQKKIQATKENIAKLLQQQEATTSRMEVSFLRKQQDQERSKQEQLQTEYDQEETRYAISSDELKKEAEELREQLEEAKDNVEKAMMAEYQTFYEKVYKTSSDKAQQKVKDEIALLREKTMESDKQLTIVQTQIKRLLDENETLRAELESHTAQETAQSQESQNMQGEYDEEGNYIYEDGSYHDTNGLYHDKDGNVYDIDGNLISTAETSKDETPAQNDNNDGQAEDDEKENVAVQNEAESSAMESDEEKTSEETELKNYEDGKLEEVPKKKRGRPRKQPQEVEEPKEKKKRGRPRKDAQSKPVAKKEKTEGDKKKRSPFKKTAGRKPSSKTIKTIVKSPTLSQISRLISEEEEKLSKMKAFINSELDDVMQNEETQSIDQEKDQIMKTVEDLKEKAVNAKQTNKSESELANINKRLEELIKEISMLNNKK